METNNSLTHPFQFSEKQCYNFSAMHRFTTDHVFILPHAEEYRVLYSIPLDQVLTTLNTPDTREGLTTGRYTAEKAFSKHQVYVYYYRILSAMAGIPALREFLA
jgi:hypothetical protein